MPNNFFLFKQFTVEQENCAMKVCTDACLFGAWVAAIIAGSAQHTSRILDIGAGTGLLSLMIAQKNNTGIIDAVEIDNAAAIQADANFRATLWKERLNIYHSSIQQFNKSTGGQYDFIICNPPFFENDLKSVDAQRNLALHSETLRLDELLETIRINLKEDGNFAVLLPFHRTKYFEEQSAFNKFYLVEKVLVKQTPQHKYFRSMLCFSRKQNVAVEKVISIKDEGNEYSAEFKELLKDYYLYL